MVNLEVMIEEKNLDNYLKQNGLKCVMFFMEGCEACNQAKSKLSEVIDDYKLTSFRLAGFTDINTKIYKKYYTEKKPVIEYAKHDDGELILDADNKPLETYAKNDDGTVRMDTPIITPNFFVFHDDAKEGDDEYGFLGNVVGYDVNKLTSILSQIEEGLKHE